MINPCKECLVQVNCTEVCPDKENFQVWLRNGIKQYQYGRLATTPHLRYLYKKLTTMETENQIDMIHVRQRTTRLKSI